MIALIKYMVFIFFIPSIYCQIETYCTRDQFNCGERCIEKVLVCDGIKNCKNNADELQCDFECDPEAMHKCRNSSKCIKNKYVCDKSPDCPEKDDEENCVVKDCGKDQFQCHFFKSQCIPNSKKCDGNEDCGDKTDEAFEICNPNAIAGWSNCKADEFRCGQGLCIPARLKCDFRKDCPDGSDEKNCKIKDVTCKSDEFRCANNQKCVKMSEKCDGTRDCDDGSDELSCSSPSDSTKCGKNEFYCGSDDIQECIPQHWVCDNSYDCFDNRDEKGCTRDCTDYEFYCKVSNKCLPNNVLCNKKDDCPDGSDEENCSERPGGTISSKCHPYKEFDCFQDGSKCVNMSVVCNKANDCTDSETSRDETPGDNYRNCKRNHCSINNGGCAHNCHNLFYKKMCSCQKGYKLQEDGLHCTDLNECKEQVGVCSQICRNLKGTFECDCRQGYTRKFSNPNRCESTGEKYLLFSSLNTIRELRMNYGKLSLLVEKPRNTLIVALDYDIHATPPRLFWSELVLSTSASRVMMMNVSENAKPKVLLDNVGIVESIAYDWINDLLYIVDSKLKRISALNVTSLFHTVIIDADLTNPRAIIIEPVNTMIYWTDWGENAKLERAGMNGLSRETLISEGIAMPNGLAFDYELNTVYWGDAKLGTINSFELTSKESRTVFRNSSIHPFSMDVFEDIVYWSDWRHKTIMSVNKFSGEGLSKVAGTETPFGIHVQHKLKQPIRVGECRDHQCAQICLPTSRLSQTTHSYTCACSIGYRLGNDSTTCIKDNKKSPTSMPVNKTVRNTSPPPSPNNKLNAQDDSKNERMLDGRRRPDIQVGTIAAIVSFVIFMIFLVGLLLGFLLRRNYINRTTLWARDLDELTFVQEDSRFPLSNNVYAEEIEMLDSNEKI